jgi:hypothetical protein
LGAFAWLSDGKIPLSLGPSVASNLPDRKWEGYNSTLFLYLMMTEWFNDYFLL